MLCCFVRFMPIFVDIDGMKLVKLFEIKNKVNQETFIFI
jgi:hypothetical protein